MLHALILLVTMAVAAPLAGYIPLAALAGVLLVVAWSMAEKEEFWALIRQSRGEAMVVIVTFLLVIFRDLTEGIVVGFALGGLVFIKRMSEAAGLREDEEEMPEGQERDGPVVVRLSGPWFFGAAARLGSVLDRIADRPRDFALDLTEVPLIDSSGARSVSLLARKVARRGGRLALVGARPAVRAALEGQGLRAPLVDFRP
jgi:SulP family sulfate permease